MGHYDNQYEEQARQEAEVTLARARRLAREKRLPVLADSEFKPVGVCSSCANDVYAIPNWGCKRFYCPHRPGV